MGLICDYHLSSLSFGASSPYSTRHHSPRIFANARALERGARAGSRDELPRAGSSLTADLSRRPVEGRTEPGAREGSPGGGTADHVWTCDCSVDEGNRGDLCFLGQSVGHGPHRRRRGWPNRAGSPRGLSRPRPGGPRLPRRGCPARAGSPEEHSSEREGGPRLDLSSQLRPAPPRESSRERR